VTDHLEQPRVQVAANDAPRIGTAAAPIQIVEFSDFQCPYCTRGRDTVKQVVAKYGDKVSVAFRHFPLPFHAEAHKAAQAAECAREKGKFWEYHDALFDHQQALGAADLVRHAKDIGLEGKPFEECLNSARHAARVDADIADGKAAGMSGTPGFYVNGIVLQGALPLEEFSRIIDKELGRSGATH
jgi:protein-disulfide isomerase